MTTGATAPSPAQATTRRVAKGPTVVVRAIAAVAAPKRRRPATVTPLRPYRSASGPATAPPAAMLSTPAVTVVVTALIEVPQSRMRWG